MVADTFQSCSQFTDSEPWPMERSTGGAPRGVAQLGSHQRVLKLHSRPMAVIMQFMVLKLKWRE